MNSVSSPFTVRDFSLTLTEEEREFAGRSWRYHLDTIRKIGQIFILLGVYQE